MGKASRARRERRQNKADHGRASSAPELIMPGSGEHSLASGYTMGMYTYGKSLFSGQAPEWLADADPLDLLFIGLACEPGYLPEDGEYILSNGREAWLDVLRPTDQWDGVQDLLRLMVRFADKQQLPIDCSDFHLGFARHLAADTSRACRRPLPAELSPSRTLAGHRTFATPEAFALATAGRPMADGHELADLLRLAEVDLDVPWDTTPRDALRLGLRRLRRWSMPGEILPVMILFAGIHGFDDQAAADFPAFGRRAAAWLSGIPEGTPLAELTDTLCAGVTEQRTAADILREVLAHPQASQPVPEQDWAWKSSMGLAAVREATALGLSPLTRHGRLVQADPVHAAIMAALEDEQAQLAARRLRRDAFGRPLADDPWFAHAQQLVSRDNIAPPRFSAATAYAAEHTGLMPPLPAGFTNPREQQQWDEAITAYLQKHPETEHDAHAEGWRRAQQMLAFEAFVAHRHPSVGQAVAADLRTQPGSWRADMIASRFPSDSADDFAEQDARARVHELARAFDVTSTSVDEALDLVTAHPKGFTDTDSQQSARALAPALFCALTHLLSTS